MQVVGQLGVGRVDDGAGNTHADLLVAHELRHHHSHVELRPAIGGGLELVLQGLHRRGLVELRGHREHLVHGVAGLCVGVPACQQAVAQQDAPQLRVALNVALHEVALGVHRVDEALGGVLDPLLGVA